MENKRDQTNAGVEYTGKSKNKDKDVESFLMDLLDGIIEVVYDEEREDPRYSLRGGRCDADIIAHAIVDGLASDDGDTSRRADILASIVEDVFCEMLYICDGGPRRSHLALRGDCRRCGFETGALVLDEIYHGLNLIRMPEELVSRVRNGDA